MRTHIQKLILVVVRTAFACSFLSGCFLDIQMSRPENLDSENKAGVTLE
jgi:hypothetical protein